MINADVDPTIILVQVIDAVRDSNSQFLVAEIVNTYLFRPSSGAPLPTGILEISYQFPLFRVDGDHRLTPPLECSDLSVDVLKLSVAIRVRLPLSRLTS